MTRIIKAAVQPQVKLNEQFKVGQTIDWWEYYNDGRVGRSILHTGVIQKVNKVTVDALDNEGNLWRVDEEDIME